MTSPEDVIATTIWLVACLCALWLTLTTLLYGAATAARVPALAGSVRWATLPVIRRLVDQALAAILVASAIPATPVRAEPPPVVEVVEDDYGLLPPGLAGRWESLPKPALRLPETNAPPLPMLPHKPEPEPVRSSLDSVTVHNGDNLWSISKRHLAGTLNRRPTDDEIAPYWRLVIATNQPDLISGNPDLIFSGEAIRMPAPSDAGG